jgi:hypothetical protein
LVGTKRTLAQAIEVAAGEEPIEAVVVGEPPEEWVKPSPGTWPHLANRPRRIPDPRLEMLQRVPVGEVMPWGKAREALSFEWDTDFGPGDAPPVVAWSTSRIIYVAEYDGATMVTFLPRHPVSFAPAFVRVEPEWDET